MSDHECCVGLELSAIGGDVPPEHKRFVVEAYDDQGVSRAASVAFATVVDELLAKGYGLDRCEDAAIVRMAEPHRVRLCPIGEPPAPLPPAQWRCEAYASAPEELKVAAWAATPFAALSAAYSALVRHRGRYRGGLDGVVSEIRTLALELERLGRDADGEGARLLGCASDRLHGALDDLAGVIETRLGGEGATVAWRLECLSGEARALCSEADDLADELGGEAGKRLEWVAESFGHVLDLLDDMPGLVDGGAE